MTTEHAVSRVRAYLPRLSDLYNRLIILAGPPGIGKTAALRALSKSEDAPLMSLGAELSRRLLDLPERQRALQLPVILDEAVAELPSAMTLLDNTEVLFSPVLKQDPLRLLQRISRNRTVVASWLGSVVDGHLTYATPDHPEFRRYPTENLLIVTFGDCNGQAAQG